jgi:TP901 family phage tail tape measure protein
MADRTVNVRLSLDTTAFRRGSQQAEQDSRRVAATAQSAAQETQNAFNRSSEEQIAAANAAMRAQQASFERTAQAAVAASRVTAEAAQAAAQATERVAANAGHIPATFAAAGTSGAAALDDITASAIGSSQALARTGAVTVNLSESAAAALGRLAGAANGAFGDVAAAAAPAASSTRLVAAAAGEIPPMFRAAATAAVASLAEMNAASARSSVAIGQTSSALTAANLAAARGVEQLSLASRLAVSQAAAAAGVVTAEVTAAQATMWGRAEMAVTGWAAAARAHTAAAATGMVNAAERGEGAFKTMRTTGLLMLAAFAAASLTAAKFEKAMSNVASVANGTAEEMGQLRDAALEAGRATAFTASQAADAEAELARAGVSVADILNGALRGALSLASAGQLSLAEAAKVAAQSMNTFGLSGRDVGHVADVLAAGANKSAADVHGLGEAMRMGGLLAKQTGLSLEDTVGTLAAFADHALVGSDAGTSLKTMLQRLTPQSTEAANMMDQLNFSAYDAQGNFVGLTQLAARMKDSFSNLTPEARNSAMGVIFGSDAVRAATILYEQGASGVDHYRDAVNDNGAAARTAAIQLDNLSGDLEALQGSLEVALIQGGTAANAVLRDMVQWVTKLVNAYSDLPQWAQTSAVAILGIGGALALVAGGLMLVVPRIAAFQTSLTTLATTMPRLAAAASGTMSFLGGPFGIILGVATAALTVFGLAHSSAKQKVEGLTDAVKADGAAIGTNTKAWLAHELETRGALKAASDLGISTVDLTDAILGNESALASVNGRLQSYRDEASAVAAAGSEAGASQDGFLGSLTKVDDVLKTMNPQINESVAAAQREAEASGNAADSTSKHGTALKKTADELKDTRTEAEKLTDQLNALNGTNISAAQAAMGMQASLEGLQKTVKENGTSLDIHSEKGREVKGAMLDAAEAAQKHAEAVLKQTGSVDQARIVFGQDVEALKHVMEQAGFTKEQIKSLTEAYAQLPPFKETKITDPGALQTIADMDRAKKAVEDVPPGKSVTLKALTKDAEQGLQSLGFQVEHMKDGTVKVTVPTSDAFNSTAAIQSYINGLKGKLVPITIEYTNVQRNPGTFLPENRQANGGIVGYANGGITAAANGLTTRQAGFSSRPILWAEAGREAYIPMDPAKRGRSTQLLGEVADEFGMQLLPAARNLIPARSLTGATGAGGRTSAGGRTTNITLQGADRDFQEQLADVVRHLEFVS